MAMSKKDFIALADDIRQHNETARRSPAANLQPFTEDQILRLAVFCKLQNPNFLKDRWLDYIAGRCGKNGGVLAHPFIGVGHCDVCGHYGKDCTGKKTKVA